MCIALIAAIAWSFTVGAQQQSSGTYTTFISGRTVVVENYTLISTDAGATVEAEIEAGGRKQKAITVVAGGKPVSFSVEAGGVKLILTEFADGAARLKIAGREAREVATDATALLENLVWHHFIFLLAQYDRPRGGAQTFKALLPSQVLTFEVRVELVGAPVYEADGSTIATNRFRIFSSSGPTVDIWTDQSQVPLLILVESQGIKVVRKGAEALAEAATRPEATDKYLSEEVTFKNGNLALAGTLTRPKGAGRHPAVLPVSGSGSQNRDGNPGAFSLFKLIGDQLSTKGIAVLRHDDRGVGQSAMPARPTSYRDVIDDTKAAIAYLRQREDVDPDRIVLLGHSEGGLTASILASEDPRIAAVALLAGAGLTTVDQLLLEQTLYQEALKQPFNPRAQEKFSPLVRRLIEMIDEAKTGKTDSAITDLNEYWRQHLALDLRAIYKLVRCPVLILQGERDALVLAHHAIEAARALSEAGNKDVLVRIFPNLGHAFTPSPLDQGIPVEQKNVVSREVLDAVEQWVTRVVGTKRGT